MLRMYRDLAELTARHAKDRVANPIRELTTAEADLVTGGGGFASESAAN